MRSINWTDVTATRDGGGSQLPAGGYVAKVTEMVDNEARQYVEVVWDVAEGEHAGHFSDDWGADHPYAHHFFMSYKDSALGMLKGRLQAIEASNPGFDPFSAWDAGRLDMFAGRLVGINLQEEEYETRDGDVRTRLNVCQVVPADDVRQGKVRAREPKLLERSGGAGVGGVSAEEFGRMARSVDVPFSRA